YPKAQITQRADRDRNARYDGAPRPAGTQDDGLGLATTNMLEVLHDQSWVIADETTAKGARTLRRGQLCGRHHLRTSPRSERSAAIPAAGGTSARNRHRGG